MKINLIPYSSDNYGGMLKGNLRYLVSYIEQELAKAKFKTSFEKIKFYLAYPQMYIGIHGMKGFNDFKKHLEELPSSRLDRRYKSITVTIQGPEFSEHLNKPGIGARKKELEVEKQYQNISEVALGKILVDKFLQAGEMIANKLKKDDRFDIELFRKVLLNIKSKMNSMFLKSMHKNQEELDKK